MKDEKKVLELIKNNNGIVKTEELSKMNINTVSLTRLLRKGLIERVARGLYISSNNIED